MKVGDYVVIKPGVHDDKMPDNRRDGLIVQFFGRDGYTHRWGEADQVLVMFSNGSFLKFHESQVELVAECE